MGPDVEIINNGKCEIDYTPVICHIDELTFINDKDAIKGNDGLCWPRTSDAKIWADKFKSLNPVIDHGTILGWFANAIMAGYDLGKSREFVDNFIENSSKNICCGKPETCDKPCVHVSNYWKEKFFNLTKSIDNKDIISSN